MPPPPVRLVGIPSLPHGHSLAKQALVIQIRMMKTKAPLIFLILLSLGLIVALILTHNKSVDEKTRDEARIQNLSNDLVTTSSHLSSQIETNTFLTNTLQSTSAELDRTAKQLSETSNSLAKTEADLKAAAAAAEAEKAELAKKDAKISELEAQNNALDKQANDLKGAIGGLETQIADTQKKLAASEGDRDFLLKELKRLQTEKAELERQFNNLAALREQVHKLKEELAISRRLEWIKKGLYGDLKGAERMQKGFVAAQATPSTNYNLNVEVHKDGGAAVVPPTTPEAPPNK